MVEVNRFRSAQRSKAGRIADKHAPPSDIHCLSNTTVLEGPVTQEPATEDMQNRSTSVSDPVHVSVKKKDTLGCRDDLGMKTHREAAAFEGGTVASLSLSSHKKGDPLYSNTVLEPWQPLFQHPPNDQAFTSRQVVDEQGDVSTSHQALSVGENQEEKMTFCSILNQMQQQQKRKPGRRCKKKTLVKMAKLLVIAQGWDLETTEMSKVKSSNQPPVKCARSETQKTEDTLKSITSNTPQTDTINITTNFVNDRGDDLSYKETALPTNSVDVTSTSRITTPKMLTELTKTCKRKNNPTKIKKQKSRNSKLPRATKMVPATSTKILDTPVLPQDTMLLSLQVKESKVQKKSKKINSTTLNEESKIDDNSNIHSNNTAPVSNHDATPKPNANKTPKDSKDGNSAAIENNITQTSSKKSVDFDSMTSLQAVTEEPLVLTVTQKDQRKPKDSKKKASCTTVTECSTAAANHNKEPAGIKSIGEVLKLKRKPGRPFKKKTLMKMAQVLAIAQEGESNSDAKQCNITEGSTLFPQQQCFPYLPQASSKVMKTKKDTKITASSSSTSPARRSPRTQSHHIPNLQSTVENIDTSPETVLISLGSIEPIVKVETSAGAPLLVPSNDEPSIQSETQGTAVENIKGWSVHPKKNPKQRKSTQFSRDSCPSQLILDESVENSLTKTMKAGIKKKTIASKSKCQTGRNTVKLHSSYGTSKKVKTRTGNDKVYDISAPREANQIPQPQKPIKRPVKNKNCKEEPPDLPLSSCQTEPSDSLCESGVINHRASSLLTTHVKTELACEQATPPMTKKSHSKTKGARKRQTQKRQNEPVLTLNTTIGGESGSPYVQCASTQDEGKQVKEETSVIKDPQKPPKGTAQRKGGKGGEKGGRRKQTVVPDLDEKCVQPEQITSQQPDSIPTEIKTEPGETYATPIKVTKAKPCRKRKLPLKDMENTKRAAIHHKAIQDGKNAVSLITGNILDAADQSLKQLGPKKRVKVESDNISTAKNAKIFATDNKHNQNAMLQGSLATSNITKSESIIATPKKVKNNVKTIRKRKMDSKQTETNDRTIVSALITSTSMLQNLSPAPQSVITVTSLPAQGQTIESKRCSQGTKMSKVLSAETLTDHGPDLKEHKTPLQCLSAFVQDTFEDPKTFEISHPRESTKIRESNNVSNGKFVIAENPQRNEINKGKNKCKTVQTEQSSSTKLVCSDTNTKEVIANPEDCFETSLTEDLQMRSVLEYNRKKKRKSMKEELTVVRTMEENNSGVDKVLNLQDNLTASLTGIPKRDVKVMEKSKKKYKTVMQKQLISDKVVDGIRKVKGVAANSGDGLIGFLENGSQINQKDKLKDKKRFLAVKGKPQVASSVEENKKVSGEVPIAENDLTTSLTEPQLGDTKDKGKKFKAIKGRLALVGSVKRSTRVVDKVPNPIKASQTANKQGNVKVNAKNKPKTGKQEMSLAKSVENRIIITAMSTKPEDNNAASLIESSPETVEMKLKDKKKTKTLIKKQTGVRAKERGKALADKVPTPRNSLKASLKGGSSGNLKRKSNGKKKGKLVKEENTAATSSEDTIEMENMILSSKNDPTTSIGDSSVLSNASLKGNLNKKSQVTTKRKGKTKYKVVKEQLTVTTSVVKEKVVNNQTDAVKSIRKVGRPFKKKTLRTQKELSSEQQKSETDTDALVNQNVDSISKVICKRGEIKASCLPTPKRRPCRASQVAKIEDAVSSYEPDLAASSLTQDEPITSMDLNVVKQEQDNSEMSKAYFKKAAYGDINKEVKQDESILSITPITKPQTKPLKKKRRRNKTGWDTKRRSKRLPSNVNYSTSVQVIDHSSLDNSGLSFNSSLCNSILDGEIISLELKDIKDHLNESQSSEVSPTNGKTNVNIKQTHTALDRSYIKDMTTNTKSKHSAKLKQSITHQQKLKKKPIECSFCGRSFRHFAALTVHKRIHTSEKPYRCLKCGKSFAQLSKLCLHSNIHKKPGVIQCPFCVCKFTNKNELMTHLKIHIKGTKKFNLINNSREGKGTHSQQKADPMDSPITPNDRTALRCSTCFKEFLNKATFKMHQQTHCEAKPFTCSICGLTFRKSSSLNVHEKTHWPVKPYACTVCGKGFVKLKELKSHSHMHSGEMPFFCANCGQAFSTLASLRSHQVSKVCFEKSDKGDRNKVDIEGFLVTQGVEGQINTPMYYKCPICKQLHHHWCHYILHLQTHSKSQPYLCETCGQQYDRVTQTYIHCKVCCNLSGEERACNASLSEIWEEPETTMDQKLEPQLDSLSNDDHEISPVGNQNLQSQEQLSFSSPLETTEKEIPDMLPTPLPPRSPSPDCQSVSNYLDISPHSPSNSDCGNAGSASPSVISCGSEQIDPQPPRFHSRSLIHRHYGRYSCGQCGKSFNQWNKLWLHQGLHRQRGSSLSCTQCALEFRFFSSYMDHLLIHAAQRPYACPLCPKTFATEENLNAHHCECHKLRDCTKCSTCGKDFTSVRKLKRHCLLHKGISSHFCLPCNLSFPRDGALQNHLKTHRVRPSVPLPGRPIEPFLFPYHCRKCTAKFTSSDLLQAHQVCHFIAGRKPSSPPADVLSRLPIRNSGTDAQAAISESPQQIRSLPVSNKKHLYRYPHPDRLYVVPIVSSETLVISDTEEEIVVLSPFAPISTSETVLPPVSEGQPSANNDYSDQNVSNIPPSSAALYSPMIIDEPEPAHCRPTTQTDTPCRPVGDPLLPRTLDQVPIHNESHQNHERATDIDVVSDCDNDSIEASMTLMTPKEKECSVDVHSCAVCKDIFTNISKLHEHYLDHARGM